VKDILCDHFQDSVDNVLLRHKSILDIISKLQQSSAQLNRAVIKSVTSCGCIQIKAYKQDIPKDADYDELKEHMNTHIEGNLCDVCKDKIEDEIGGNLFYLAALCNSLNINLYDIILKEFEQLKTLGKFSLY